MVFTTAQLYSMSEEERERLADMELYREDDNYIGVMCYMHHCVKDFLGGHLPDGTCPFAKNTVLPSSKLFEDLY